MADYLGNVLVPEPPLSTSPFPLIADYPISYQIEPVVIVHQFGSANSKIEQRFNVGTGARRFHLQFSTLTLDDLSSLREFWESQYGPYGSFPYDAPNPDGTTTEYTCRFEDEPLSWELLADSLASSGVTLVEVPSSPPTYSVSSTVTRFPSGTLETALLSQTQALIPLLKLQPRESGYPAIYLSDRRCTIGGQLYLPRLLSFDGISQSMGNESDQATFTLGNADRVLRDLANDTDLFRADLEFSLFHVSTTIKLDLWKGDVIDWQIDASAEFRLIAADGLYELNLPYPCRRISRSCWKDFDSTNSCPYTAQGSLDLVNFPSASALSCDKGFATANGCRAHSMNTYFGGVVAAASSVNIKDNSTGVWGYRRANITSVSLQADTVYEEVMPEIYVGRDPVVSAYPIPMPVNAKVISGREESEFYDALGIVGEGPITAFGADHTLDNQIHHDNTGPRVSYGNDPNPNPFGVTTGIAGETLPTERAAGTAFVEIRRNDEVGFQPTRIAEHSMVVNVAEGLKGWVWTGAGARTEQVLTNPIWIVINMLLRARGLRYANAATAEALFDVDSAVSAAAVCDLQVDCIIDKKVRQWIEDVAGYEDGEGVWHEPEGHVDWVDSSVETQYQFRGVLQEEKPLRDWIQEVLMNCLGYFTFTFGKLKIGLHDDASIVETFTLGNILFNSLTLTPLRPSYNHLTATFGDEEFGFVANSVSVYDIDHAKLIGGATAPLYLKGTINLSGSSTKSQVARIISTRLREELGGTEYAEWKAARRLTFRTTVLSLAVEPGMVCSMTHDDMPDLGSLSGYGQFRVTGWKLNPDFSIDIEGQTITDSMYDLTEGPKPADVVADLVPVEYAQYPKGLVWHPHAEQPDADDPMFDEDDWSFSLSQEYSDLADETVQAEVVVQGKFPVSKFVPGVDPPAIRTSVIDTTDSSGTLSGDHYYYFSVCAVYSDGRLSPPSNIVSKFIPVISSGTNSITLSNITWPDGDFSGYILFGSMDHQELLCLQEQSSGLPSSISILTTPSRSTWGLPSPWLQRVRVRGKRVYHSGPVGATISSIDSSGRLVCDSLTGLGDDWTGRKLSVIADESDGSAPLWNFLVTDYEDDSNAGYFTVTPDPVVAGVEAGDVLIVRTAPTAVTSTSITDAKWENGVYPAGMTTDEEIGRLVRILSGPGRGQVRRVIDNDSTTLTIDNPWDEDDLPTTESVFIVEAPDWVYFSESEQCNATDFNVTTTIRLPIDNLLEQVAIIQATTLDQFGVETPDSLAGVREIYLFGSEGDSGAVWRNGVPLEH